MVNSIKSNCDCLLGKEVHVNDRPKSMVHVMSQKTSKFPSHWNETFCIRTRMEEINCVLTGRSNQTEVGRSSVVILKSLPSCTYNFHQFLIYSTFVLVLLQKHMLYLRGPLH